MTEQHWDADTIAEAVACYREARAIHRTLAEQHLRLYGEIQHAEGVLRQATHLYERCLQETATVPETHRQLDALIAERDEVTS